MRLPLSFLGVLLLLCWLPAGCGPAARGDLSGRAIRVTTTTGMVADTVRNVGGERVQVTALMGPGVDPHLFKPSEGDIGRLQDADAIFYNGLNLEGKMTDILVKLAQSKPTVAVTEAIDTSLLREPPEFQGHYDPHIWFDVSMWAKTIPPVVETLSKLDPANASLYRENGDAYARKLEALHEECRTQLAAIPKPRRVLVTAHDAFGYFGRAYEIEVKGLQGISTLTEASVSGVQKLVDLIAGRKIPAVFVESSVSRKAIEAVVEGCRARGHQVRIGGTLYSDAMGPAGTPEGTYPGMVRKNVETIVAALK